MPITSLGFRTDVALRVLEGAQVGERGDYLVVRTPDNPNYWWGNFLLLPRVPGPGEAGHWLARFAAEFPAAQHVTLGVDTAADVLPPDVLPPDGLAAPGLAADPPAARLPADLTAAGLTADHAAVLITAAPQPPARPSTEAEIRPLDSDADWQQSVELSARCYDGQDPGDYLERRTVARRRITREGHGAWFGAFSDGLLQAQLGLLDAGDGYARYQHVETDPRARRRGLAGTLVWAAGQYGRDVLGARTFVIVADPAGAAIRIYQAGGFTRVQAQLSLERPPPAY